MKLSEMKGATAVEIVTQGSWENYNGDECEEYIHDLEDMQQLIAGVYEDNEDALIGWRFFVQVNVARRGDINVQRWVSVAETCDPEIALAVAEAVAAKLGGLPITDRRVWIPEKESLFKKGAA